MRFLVSNFNSGFSIIIAVGFGVVGIMAVQATQLLVRTGSSPKTPGNTTLVTEAGGLPLHITPLDMVESDHNPSTPHKVSSSLN